MEDMGIRVLTGDVEVRPSYGHPTVMTVDEIAHLCAEIFGMRIHWRFEVHQGCIDAGVPDCSSRDPVSFAIKEHPQIDAESVLVCEAGDEDIQFHADFANGRSFRFVYRAPDSVTEFISAFDAGEKVEPFAFELSPLTGLELVEETSDAKSDSWLLPKSLPPSTAPSRELTTRNRRNTCRAT